MHTVNARLRRREPHVRLGMFDAASFAPIPHSPPVAATPRDSSLENNYVVDGINTGSLCGAMAPSLLLNHDDSLSTACFHQDFACVPAFDRPYYPTFGTTVIHRFYPFSSHRQR